MGGLGGHLAPDENLLPVPPANISKYLYDMRSISYYHTINDEYWNKTKNQNFFALINGGGTFEVRAFISSNRPGRVMREVSIYYECVSGSDCSLTYKN